MSGSSSPGGRSIYRAVDLYELRAPVLPADTFSNLADNQAEHGHDVDAPALRSAGHAHLGDLVRSARVRQALHAASPTLIAALSGLDDGRKDSDGLRSSLLRYLTRMSTRPTPHGLFSGVAIGTFGHGTNALLDRDPVLQTRTRADGGWLGKVIADVENDRAVRDRLPVRVDDLTYRAGPFRILHRTYPEGSTSPERIELSATGALELAVDLARARPLFGDLLAALSRRFSDTPEGKIRGLLDQLWEVGILRSDLAAPPTEALPERHLAERLSDLGIRPDLAVGLRRTRQLADEIDHAAGHADLGIVKSLAMHQRTLTPGFDGPTYQLDTALSLRASALSAGIAEAAAEAGEVLMRLGCTRPRMPHVADYHRMFLERYGVDSELPLVDVLNPETGLGPPNTYHVPARRQPLPEDSQSRGDGRDQALVDLAMRASRNRVHEVHLNQDQLDALSVWSTDDPHHRPRTSLDLFLQVASSSADAIDAGDWMLVPSTVGYYGGWQGFGRFFDLFDDTVLERIRAQQQLEEGLRPETIFAELNYQPIKSRAANISVHPVGRDFEICVNTTPSLPSSRQIPLEDVMVGANGTGLYLRSRALGRRISVTQSHALSPTMAPNICRALLDFSSDGFTPLARFDWGVMRDAPHLPRLVWEKTVLHPAQWTITPDTFSSEDLYPERFYTACQRWRREWNIPRHVYIIEDDNRLLLDLEHPLWVDELLKEIGRGQRGAGSATVRLHEMIPDPDQLWLRDTDGRRYHSEIVVPLVLRTLEPIPAIEVGANSSTSTTRRWLPGDEWIHLKLYAAAESHDAIIAGPLRSLLADEAMTELVDRWFYIRYADPLPHLRLRFRSGNPDSANLMARCAAWARRLVATGMATDFAFASYDREVERYGGGEAIDAIEEVFWQNSVAAADLVGLLRLGKPDLDPEIVAVAALHELYRSWGVAPQESTTKPTDATRRDFRSIRALLGELLAPGERRPDSRTDRYVSTVMPILARQQHSLEGAGKRIRQLADEHLLVGSERNVIESLAHIQSIRLLGLDADREQKCRHLYSLAQRAIRGRTASRRGSEEAPIGKEEN